MGGVAATPPAAMTGPATIKSIAASIDINECGHDAMIRLLMWP
jgi:hypothetical protein